MKRFEQVSPTVLILATALTLVGSQAYAHRQHIHQYLSREAYLLLRTADSTILELPEHIGGLDQFYAADSAWQRPFVTTGAWREDEEDVVFGYDVYPSPVINNYALVSITHFWDADQGDLVKNMIRLQVDNPWPVPPLIVDIGPFENAYDKFMRFANGHWVLWYPRPMDATNVSNGHRLIILPIPTLSQNGIPLSYDTLTTFFITRQCRLRADAGGSFSVFDVDAWQTIDPATVPVIEVEVGVRDKMCWEVLGRMCHLLQDMSVPAHAHRDEHGLNPDSFENSLDDAANIYTAWDHLNVGPVIDPYTVDNDPLHFLIYVVQQQSDHFGSNGPADGDGNDVIGGNPRAQETLFLEGVGLSSLGPPTGQSGPWTVQNLNAIRDRVIPLAIRATAGLLNWFSRETGLRPVNDRPDHNTGATTPGSISLEQNYPNPFNASTLIRFTVAGSREYGVGSKEVKLAVYDLLGREITVLVSEKKAPGDYDVKFDGSGLSSGVYICRMSAGNFLSSRKMTLLK
jgi:hypothetical protein